MLQWAKKLIDTPERARQRCAHLLAASGLPYVRDVVIPDQVGGYTQIDHLLLTPRGLALFEWQYFVGTLHGSAHSQEWTRFESGQRHDFINPLRHVQQLAETLDSLVLGAKVGASIESHLIATGTASFAKGLPPGVMDEAGLRAWLDAQSQAIPSRQQAVWNVLLSRVACEPVVLQTSPQNASPHAADSA